MEMIEVKTDELVGAALDWAVAKALGYYDGEDAYHNPAWMHGGRYIASKHMFCPSTDWSQGGPLIEKYNLAFRVRHYEVDALYDAYSKTYVAIGRTHLVAACRAIVYARLGEVVKIPQELA